jgi:hypothetical protein
MWPPLLSSLSKGGGCCHCGRHSHVVVVVIIATRCVAVSREGEARVGRQGQRGRRESARQGGVGGKDGKGEAGQGEGGGKKGYMIR